MTYHPAAGLTTVSTQTASTSVVFSGTTVVSLFADQKTAAAAQVGTITNSPVAGNPNYWWPINVSGTTRNIPCW